MAVRQAEASSEHSLVCSPVAGDQRSEKDANGTETACQPSPAGTENLAL